MAWVLIPIALVTLWVVSLYKIRSSCSASVPSNPRFLSNGDTRKKRNVLVVVAHPDDESMFFAPTILFLASEGHILHILCLSTGNADGKGNVRKEELYRACAVLKVPSQKVKILDHPNLQDGFGNPWDHQLIAKIVEEKIEMYNIDSLITFDKIGVSGHQNHRDVHHGIWRERIRKWSSCYSSRSIVFVKASSRVNTDFSVHLVPLRSEALQMISLVVIFHLAGTSMLLRENSKRDIEAWELVSTSILRKYSGPVDIWLSTCFLSCDKERTYSLMNKHPGVIYLAMAEHYSQWIWFRKLFVLFSSYTYMNTLRKIQPVAPD